MRAGICTTKQQEFDFICDVDWMKKARVRGIVIWPRILFADAACDIPNWLFRHELEHAYQMMRESPIRFYAKYFYYSLRYDYELNPYEVEARERQLDPLTTTEEQLLWKLREG